MIKDDFVAEFSGKIYDDSYEGFKEDCKFEQKIIFRVIVSEGKNNLLIDLVPIFVKHRLMYEQESSYERNKISFFIKYIETKRKFLIKSKNGDILLPRVFRGIKIGSFIFNTLLEWAKTIDSSATVIPGDGKLAIVDAETDSQKNRRNRFYEKFNFAIEYFDDDKKIGEIKPTLVNEIVTRKDLSFFKNDTNSYISFLISELNIKKSNIQNLTSSLNSKASYKCNFFLKKIKNQQKYIKILCLFITFMLFVIAYIYIVI